MHVFLFFFYPLETFLHTLFHSQNRRRVLKWIGFFKKAAYCTVSSLVSHQMIRRFHTGWCFLVSVMKMVLNIIVMKQTSFLLHLSNRECSSKCWNHKTNTQIETIAETCAIKPSHQIKKCKTEVANIKNRQAENKQNVKGTNTTK